MSPLPTAQYWGKRGPSGWLCSAAGPDLETMQVVDIKGGPAIPSSPEAGGTLLGCRQRAITLWAPGNYAAESSQTELGQSEAASLPVQMGRCLHQGYLGWADGLKLPWQGVSPKSWHSQQQRDTSKKKQHLGLERTAGMGDRAGTVTWRLSRRPGFEYFGFKEHGWVSPSTCWQ